MQSTAQNNTAAFSKAINEFKQWCQENPQIFNDMFGTNLQSRNNSIATAPTGSGSTDNSSDDSENKGSVIGSAEHDKLSEIAAGIENGLNTARALSQNQELLDMEKGFADIVNKGPSNAIEQQLMQAVDTHLEPHEKEQAIRDNTKVGEVVKSINQSITRANDIVTQELHKEKKAEQQEKEGEKEKQQDNRKAMTSLGEEFGVLEKLVESMREALNKGKEKEQNLTQEKKNYLSWMKGGQKVEGSISQDAAKTFKSMPKDPAHAQSKGQGREM